MTGKNSHRLAQDRLAMTTQKAKVWKKSLANQESSSNTSPLDSKAANLWLLDWCHITVEELLVDQVLRTWHFAYIKPFLTKAVESIKVAS